MDHSFQLRDLSHLKHAAKWFIETAGKHSIIAFYGDLGSGKTTFIQELCKQWGVEQEVTSPTFALVNEYSSSNALTIYHFDFYRLDQPEEALDIGLEDYLSSGNICCMEWPEKIEPFLPPETLRVYIDVLADKSRLISLVFPA